MTKEEEICFETLLLNHRHGVASQNTCIFVISLVTTLKLQCVFIVRVSTYAPDNAAKKKNACF